MADGRDARRLPGHWGPELLGAGEVRFRVWAPGVDSLRLRLDGDDADMIRSGDGWFERVASGVENGAAYGFVLPDGLFVPDPASRGQKGDVHGPSLVVDPDAYGWRNTGWTGRPWPEAVISEIHVGTFTPEGTFRAAAEHLPHLAKTGFTAVELMPVAQFSGRRGWGYDGVLPYAPHNAYGTQEDMKQFVDEAHGLGLMVLLDVVYNHFGPDGNYLPLYAPDFFDPGRHTPWGNAIAYDRAPVRRFFVDNALYWLDEFRLDGLRLDAVDQIRDQSDPELLTELARTVRAEFPDRQIHLTTEDNRNVTHLHAREGGRTTAFTGEWNDDFHNAAHVLLTGEKEGYYEDFADDPARHLARCLAEGFAYQGEPSPHACGVARGEPSAHLPPTVFVDFLQNHDQVGNRGFGERLSVLADPLRYEVLTAMMILSPHIPMLFMGEEWGERHPFLFFTDFHGKLGDAVREGRRKEFAGFSAFASSDVGETIPDPNAVDTFDRSKIDWAAAESEEGRARLELHQTLFALRRDHVVPLLDDGEAVYGEIIESDGGVVAIDWHFPRGRLLQLRANLGDRERKLARVGGEVIYRSPGAENEALQAWSLLVAVAP